MNRDECGAPEFFTGGAKLIPLPGDHGKIDTDALVDFLEGSGVHGEHESLPQVISLTQCTESGAVYSLDELREFLGRHGVYCYSSLKKGLSMEQRQALFLWLYCRLVKHKDYNNRGDVSRHRYRDYPPA